MQFSLIIQFDEDIRVQFNNSTTPTENSITILPYFTQLAIVRYQKHPIMVFVLEVNNMVRTPASV